MNSTQILLSVMVVLLGVTLVIIGIQVFFVLRDLRRNLERTERVLADVEKISSKLVEEQAYVDEVIVSVRNIVRSATDTAGSLSGFAKNLTGPMSIGLAVFQAFTKFTHKSSSQRQED